MFDIPMIDNGLFAVILVIFTFAIIQEISCLLTFLCWNRFPPGTPVFPIRLKVHAIYFDYLSI